MDSENEDDPQRARTPESVKRRRGESSKKLEHKKQKFRNEWLQDSKFSNWLIPVPNNQLMAKCKLCSSEMTAELSVIKKHSTTKIHSRNVPSVGSQQPLMKGFINNQAKLNELQKIKKAELLLCGVLSEHNLSFNVIDHITAVCKVAFDDSKIASGINLGRTKATSIVKNVIGKSHSEEIANILKSTYFSVIIDESTDVGCVKTLCICVKYFDVSNDKFQTKFFKLIQLFTDSKSANEGATAEKIFDELLKAFNESEIPLDNIIGKLKMKIFFI